MVFSFAALVSAGCSGGGDSSPTQYVPSAKPAAAPSDALEAPEVGPSGPTLTTDTDWVTFGHDLSRTSRQPSAGGISAANVSDLTLLWAYQSAAPYDTAGPIEAGGIVYASDASGDLAAFDAQSGAIVWQRQLGATVKMTPALFGGILFVATFVDTSKTADSNLLALNPQTGAILWNQPTNGGVHGAPVAIAGSLYVPISIGDPGYCHPGGVYVFNAATGAPRYEWQTVPGSTDGGGAVWSSVTYDGSRLLFGTGNTCAVSPTTANAVVSISTASKLLWSDNTADPLLDDDVGGSVSIADGAAFVTGKTGYTYALDPATGTRKWAMSYGAPDGDGGFSTPALAGSSLVLSGGFPSDPYTPVATIAQYGMLFGVDPASGRQQWEQTAVAPYWAPVATTSDLTIATDDANVEDIDSATGATVWSTPIIGDSRAQPIIARGEVIVVDQSGHLYAFGLPNSANADTRRRFASLLKNLPEHNVVPTLWRLPAYCKI